MRTRLVALVSAWALVAGCGGGGGTGVPPPSTPESPALVSMEGVITAALGGTFTLRGERFPAAPGTGVSVRFDVSDGLPFGACGVTSVFGSATVESPTSASGAVPGFALLRDVTAFVEVDFGDVSARSSAPIASFLGQPDRERDQDLDGLPDGCDPSTYVFDGDAVGARPAGVTSEDGLPTLLSVRASAGGNVAAYAPGNAVPYDVLDRLRADAPQQDLDLLLDLETGAGDFNIEVWSHGSYRGRAGSGLIFQVQSSGQIVFYERLWSSILTSRSGPLLPPSGRVRLRVRKLAGTSSEVRLDLFNAGAWQDDAAVWPVADDRQYRGLDVTLCSYWFGGATRGVRRLSAVHALPAAPLTLARSSATSTDRMLFQRDAADVATLPLRLLCRPVTAGRVEARVLSAESGATLPGHDWSDHAMAVPARPAGLRVDLPVAGVPTGGNYDVQVRLMDAPEGGAVVAQQVLRDVAVGDVWIAAGQSNMSGYSGTLFGADAPIPEVHLFGNDGRWKEAAEPVDEGTDQTDAVSYENPWTSCLLAFGKELWARTGVPVALVPTSLGGTNLYSQWQRYAPFPAHRGTLYGSMLARARQATRATPPRGLLWFQGESDALAARTRAQYKLDLETLVSGARSDLGAPDLVFLCGQLGTYVSANLALWLPVQEAQRLAVAGDARAGLVTAVDLPRSDGIHFNVAGYGTLGRRFATAARRLVFGHAVDATDDLLSAQAGAGGASVVLTFEAPVTGGAPSLFQVSDGGGAVGVTSVATSGSTVTLSLSRALSTAPSVSYGWSVDPAAAWLKDAAGAAVPCFEGVAVLP